MPELTDNLSMEPDAAPAPLSVVNHEQKKRRTLLMLLGYSALHGFLVPIEIMYNPEGKANLLYIVLQIPFIVLILMWCVVDADQRNHNIGKMMKIGLILLGVVAFPIYIFQTRGIAGFKSLFLAILFLAAMFFFTFLTAGMTILIGVMSGFLSIDSFE
jgi:hypothetical protein